MVATAAARRVPATEVARRAGHGVAVLLKIYAHCIDDAAAMLAYADEITAHAADLGGPEAAAAREWASWIRQHAERTSPLNGALHVLEVTSCGHQERSSRI